MDPWVKRFFHFALDVVFNRFYIMVCGGFNLFYFFSAGGIEILIDLSQAGLFILGKSG